MDVLKKLFRRKKKEDKESPSFPPISEPQEESEGNYKGFLEDLGIIGEEIPEDVEERTEEGVTFVKSISLVSLSDVEPLGDELKRGNILIVNLDPLLQRASGQKEVDRVVARLKGIIKLVGGDIAQIKNLPYVIMTPKNVRIKGEGSLS
ncbi:MAG: cell division protein SepF [Candidatus Odinarchaeota archaeon]|nr:cell division protein SepF [Candidatus Odinarchaeota archaeon]